MLYKLLRTKSDLTLSLFTMSLDVQVSLVLQFIPTTLVANGPLVWEAEQQINSVSLMPHYTKYYHNVISKKIFPLFCSTSMQPFSCSSHSPANQL